jgi:alpha-L-fucosidase
MGKWMYLNSRSIYGCTQAPDDFKAPKNCLLTYNPTTKRLYIHVLEWPIQTLNLPGFAGKFKYAQLLNDASEVRFGVNGADVTLNLPVHQPNTEVPVIELYLE